MSVRWRKDGPKSVSRWSSEGHSRSHLSNFEGLWRQSFLNCQSRKSNDSMTVLLYFKVLRGLVRGCVARSLVYIRLPLDSWGHAVTISATCCFQSCVRELLAWSRTSGTCHTRSPPPSPPPPLPLPRPSPGGLRGGAPQVSGWGAGGGGRVKPPHWGDFPIPHCEETLC